MNIIALLFFGRYLEPIWGGQELLKFVALVNLTSGVTTFFSMILIYLSTKNEAILLYPFCGFGGVVIGFAVAMKQLIPDTELKVALVVPVRAKVPPHHITPPLAHCSIQFFPALFLIAALVVTMLGLPVYPLPHTIFGLISSWIYLRFLQIKGDLQGDRSDTFSFVSFFPEFMQ